MYKNLSIIHYNIHKQDFYSDIHVAPETLFDIFNLLFLFLDLHHLLHYFQHFRSRRGGC